MKKVDSNKNSSLIFDKKGTSEVSRQIMNAYNSGYINKQGLHADLEHSFE